MINSLSGESKCARILRGFAEGVAKLQKLLSILG
jgi:hypothetical protein